MWRYDAAAARCVVRDACRAEDQGRFASVIRSLLWMGRVGDCVCVWGGGERERRSMTCADAARDREGRAAARRM